MGGNEGFLRGDLQVAASRGPAVFVGRCEAIRQPKGRNGGGPAGGRYLLPTVKATAG